MTTRNSKANVPIAPRALSAAEVPVTRAMLSSVRTEVLQRIDQAREEAKADNQRLDAKIQKLDAKIDAVKAELKAEIQAVRAELKDEIQGVRAELQEVKADLHEVKAGMHAMQAQMSRIEVLMEEQNSRNKVVLDALIAVLARQDQVEQRVSQVEDTVRKLASTQPPAERT